jgi:hypothetical protein
MEFSDYAQGLLPYISGGASEPIFFTEIIGNFIQDASMDACAILKRKEDTRYRYIRGVRKIQSKDAQYIYDHRDMDKYSEWLSEQMDSSDSFDAVSSWLMKCEIEHDKYHVADACATLLESILLEIITGTTASGNAPENSEYDFKLVEEIQEKIKSLPRPAELPIPRDATTEEKGYINELYNAYGDAEGVSVFNKEDLPNFPEYQEDLSDRRIDFYAAETIRRGIMELGRGGLSNQFDVLKGETYDCVKDTERSAYPNGYERMLAVMGQAVMVPLRDYLLCESPYWISGKIKKGVCHQLVNDGKLKWVKKKR